MGLSRSYTGATAQQQQWTEDAINGASFPWDRIALTAEFHFVSEATMQGSGHFDKNRYLFGDTRLVGGVAIIRIWDQLDTKGFDEYEGKDFFGETIIHELGHALQFTYIDTNGTVGDGPDTATLVALYHDDLGRRGTVADWDPTNKLWEQRIIEAFAEFFKDVYFDGRKFDDRTDWRVDEADFTAWLDFVGSRTSTSESSGQLEALGDGLGVYNAPGSAWGAGGDWPPPSPDGRGPGWIYGLTLDSLPGQPEFLSSPPGTIHAYDYILLPGIDRVAERPFYPFVYFWPSLDRPRNWKLSAKFSDGANFFLDNPTLLIGHLTWGPIDLDIYVNDLDVDTAFYSQASLNLDEHAAGLAATCMGGATPAFDYRDYTGWRGWNDNEPNFPFDGVSLVWQWDEGGSDPLPGKWPYVPHEYDIGSPDHGHILHHRPVTGHGIS